jgi:hypothetical protein
MLFVSPENIGKNRPLGAQEVRMQEFGSGYIEPIPLFTLRKGDIYWCFSKVITDCERAFLGTW